MAPFHKLLDKVTGEGLLDTDWDGNLRCVDLVRQKDVTPKDAIKSIKKRMVHKNPNVALHALVLLEMVVKNCGQPIHKEVATAAFMKDFRGLIEGSPRGVKLKALAMIQTWGLAFRDQPGFRVVADTYNILRMEGHEFQPPSADANPESFLSAETMPEWAESKECGICRTKFSLTNRRHHCRCCGKSFCGKCSSKEVPLAKFGVEKPVRVCDFCYEQETGKDAHDTPDSATSAGAGASGSGADATDMAAMQKLAMQNNNLTPEEEVALAIERDRSLAASATKQPSAGGGGGGGGGSAEAKAREQELKEREEMELAMALSMSEAESSQPKQQQRQMQMQPAMQQNYDYLEASAPEPSPSPAPSASSVYGSAFAEMQSHVDDVADTYQPVVTQAPAPVAVVAAAPAPVAVAAAAPPQVTFQPPAELQAQYDPVQPQVQPQVAAAAHTPGQAYELDYTVANPLANEQDQVQLKSVQSGLALFELKLNRAATKGLGIQNNVEIQALLRSLSLMHPDLLARAGQLGEIKEKNEALREKYREIKAARQRYSDRCELYAHKMEEQRREQELLQKVQLEQKMKLIEQQEADRMAQQHASQQAQRAAMEARAQENQRQMQMGQQRLAEMQRNPGYGGGQMQQQQQQQQQQQYGAPLPQQQQYGAPTGPTGQPSDAQRMQALHDASAALPGMSGGAVPAGGMYGSPSQTPQMGHHPQQPPPQQQQYPPQPQQGRAPGGYQQGYGNQQGGGVPGGANGLYQQQQQQYGAPPQQQQGQQQQQQGQQQQQQGQQQYYQQGQGQPGGGMQMAGAPPPQQQQQQQPMAELISFD